MFEFWAEAVAGVLSEAGLPRELPPPGADLPDGRRGVRTAEFAGLYAELTEVWRVEPQARW